MRRLPLAVLLAVCVPILAACGTAGGGGESRDVTQLVSRDFGTTKIDEQGPAPTEAGDTILSLLRSTTKVVTDGGTVTSIGGLAATSPRKWAIFVNGVALRKDPADVEVKGGDRIWWDLRDATAAPVVQAVVGSYPGPYLDGGGEAKRWPLRVECARNLDKAPCNAVAEALGKVGVIAGQSLVGADGGKTNMRVEVGPWANVRDDRAARLIDEGTASSGVYAKFSADGTQLSLLDASGKVTRTLGAGTGLIAATRYQDEPPTWFVTGTDQAGVQAAVRALDEGTLSRHYALAISDDRGIALPTKP
jgi:predicted small secreted protein